MKQTTIDQLDELFTAGPVLLGGGSDQETEEAENSVGIKFENDYRLFVQRYGGAMVGSLPIYGLRIAEVMGVDETVTAVNARLRSQGWQTIEEWVVISDSAGVRSVNRLSTSFVSVSALAYQVGSTEQTPVRLSPPVRLSRPPSERHAAFVQIR